MSNSIGFKNFRRFQNFPEIDLGDITILVGGNNAGKSTLVKAMLLMRDFLNSRIEKVDNTNNIFRTFERPNFSFDTEHVNVGDFYRAFCHQSSQKEDTISFTMKIENFRFIVNIQGERKPGVIPQVTMIAVSDEERNVSFTFDFSKNQMTVRFEYDKEAINDDAHTMREHKLQLDALKKKLSKSKDFNEISNLKIEIEQLEKITSYIFGNDVEISEYDEIKIPMSYFIGDNVGKMVIPELIKGFTHYSETGTTGDKRTETYRRQEANKNILRGKSSLINSISEEVERVINSQTIEYIYAHSVAQTPFYANCASTSDYTKRTIHEFYNARISKKDEEFLLIEEWLREFNIGNSLKVIPFGGDNYRIVIFDDENPEIKGSLKKGYPGGIDLADKGMGSIQLVILLLRIATLLRRFHGQQLTILLEEPEQNLHPALQSKLAEFVYSVNYGYMINFIVETHSEYFVRKTQVIVAGENYNDVDEMNSKNPFVVYFLERNPEDEPRKMTYKLSGDFNEKFGEGFFDEASKWDMVIIRKEFELNKKNRK